MRVEWPTIFTVVIVITIANQLASAEMEKNTIQTYLPLHPSVNNMVTVYLQTNNDLEIPQEKITVIKDAITSEKVISISENSFYVGWQGALKSISNNIAESTIPTNFEFVEDKNNAAIIIEFKNEKSNYDGYTKVVENENSILRAHIIIYNFDFLSDHKLNLIVKHEFGHALGLGHSSFPDLMYQEIPSNFSFISDCDILTIIHLYEGALKSNVPCDLGVYQGIT